MAATQHNYDLVIRGGTICDGSGGVPFRGDVAVRGDRIAAVGDVRGSGREEIDANGCIVTPGFVDVHTHYDGQAIWSQRMLPSSVHGVTTVVMGNCGVGFAPCRPQDQELLINAMEGVEDIPEVVMSEGLTWDWETFPDFLDALEKRPHDIDIAAYVPHSALRVYVMGERGANREPATRDDIEEMARLVREAMAAGAMGFATSRITLHKRIDGEAIPSYQASEEELTAIAHAVAAAGGVVQLVPELLESSDPDEIREQFELLHRISRNASVRVTFTLAQRDLDPMLMPKVLSWVREANRELGTSLRPQIFPRPVGMIVGFDLSANPFVLCPGYKAIAHLPLAERLVELRKADVRARLVVEEPDDPTLPLITMARRFDRMFEMGDNPDYEPDMTQSILERARRAGGTPEELAYDLMLENDGKAMLFLALGNYAQGSLEHLGDAILHPDVVVGLGDGGAHYGLICDASYPTFMLAYWTRDRANRRLPLAQAVRSLTYTPAEMIGLADRGLLKNGLKADINVIDYDHLHLFLPEVRYDLPTGGRRLHQAARGYRATIVNGQVILRDDTPTDVRAGRLVRGRQVAEREAA